MNLTEKYIAGLQITEDEKILALARNDAIEQLLRTNDIRKSIAQSVDVLAKSLVKDSPEVYSINESILREIISYAKHKQYCSAVLSEGARCNCGFGELMNRWENR